VLDLARGVVRGTPMASASGQTFTFAINVTDSSSPPQAASNPSGATYSITVK
jgi:hypothetical protein